MPQIFVVNRSQTGQSSGINHGILSFLVVLSCSDSTTGFQAQTGFQNGIRRCRCRPLGPPDRRPKIPWSTAGIPAATCRRRWRSYASLIGQAVHPHRRAWNAGRRRCFDLRLLSVLCPAPAGRGHLQSAPVPPDVADPASKFWPYLIKYTELPFKTGLNLTLSRSNLNNVESNGLGKWSALSNSHNVTLLNSESWRNVSSEILVSLLVSVVFRDVVQVVSSDDDGSVHFGGHNSTGQNSTSDRDSTGERTLLVNVGTLNSGLRSLESQTDVLVPSLGSSGGLGLWVGEDVWLLRC
ncbi:hypothetical protein OGATHE_000236 [Ogataea polymorpha]|uniref:Uncharacterized protein n=1 Tax=Ogataea polymorpha TaxID=460523 RepID=A0A9P8PUR8_9ASCO|nr:hypothetical protein OGATHE_000236 [Ogataea polymorpha]